MNELEFNGRKLDLSRPAVMGILNLTPDSFYDGGFYADLDSRVAQAGRMLDEGAAIIDIGGVSTRPGSGEIQEEEEMLRVMPALQAILRAYPECLVSIDTYRSRIAQLAVDNGAFMINDIFGGTGDPEMIPFIASCNVPYVMMHIRGKPLNMQEKPVYGDVVAEISYFFDAQLKKLQDLNFRKTILDPGFGFGKTVEHNFEILRRLGEFFSHGYPLMAGLSRKSMINKVLGTNPSEAKNGTTVLNTIALLKGVSILRVHDVREAVEAVRLVEKLREGEIS